MKGEVPLLKVENLVVRSTKSGVVLNAVSFEVFPRDVIVIVGQSGAGKTTLLLALLGALDSRNMYVESGKVIYNGCFGRSESKLATSPFNGLKIGFVPQNPEMSLDPYFTVYDQMDHLIRSHYPKEDAESRRKRIYRFMTKHSIDPRSLKRHPYAFSVGELQRIAVAMAEMIGPQLILADEPTASLDVVRARVAVDSLAGKLDENIALLVATHDPVLVRALQKREGRFRIYVMKGGRFLDESDEYYSHFIQYYTA